MPADAGGASEAPPPASLPIAAELAELEIQVAGLAQDEGVATIELVHEPSDGASATRTLHPSDADGHLRLTLAPGSVRAVAWSAHACAPPASAALTVGEPARIELALESALPVAGRVIDADSGRPVAGARVSFWTFAEGDEVMTDADGVFRHPRFPARAPAQQIAARAAGYGNTVRVLRLEADGRWKLAARLPSEASLRGTGTPWIELELVPELRVRGRVVRADGAPYADAHVIIEGYHHVLPAVAARDAAEATSDADGRFELGGLRSDVGHSLALQAPGFACEPRELAPCAGLVELGTLVLTPETLLTGVVIDAGGVPVADAEVVLRVAGGEPTLGAAWDAGARLQGRELRARTSAEGTFLFEGLSAVPVQLSVEREDGTRAALTLEPRSDRSFDTPCLMLVPAPSVAQRPH